MNIVRQQVGVSAGRNAGMGTDSGPSKLPGSLLHTHMRFRGLGCGSWGEPTNPHGKTKPSISSGRVFIMNMIPCRELEPSLQK